jgi:hypothetical protein
MTPQQVQRSQERVFAALIGLRARFEDSFALALFDMEVKKLSRYSPEDFKTICLGQHLPCSKHHSGSCGNFALMRLVNVFGRALKVYSPVHICTYLLFNARELKNKPLRGLLRIAASLLRTCAFVSLYIGTNRMNFCIFNHLFGGLGPITFVVISAIGTHAIYLERESRRVDFAMWLLPRSLEFCYNLAKATLKFRPLPYGEVLLFAVSMGLFVSLMGEDRKHLKKSYANALAKLLGEN